MAKKQVMITIDEEVWKRAKEKYMNISGECEHALKLRSSAEKKDLPQEVLIVRCSRCRKEIDEGYWCRERGIVVCSDCQAHFHMEKCPHDINGEHEHIKWGGIKCVEGAEEKVKELFGEKDGVGQLAEAGS